MTSARQARAKAHPRMYPTVAPTTIHSTYPCHGGTVPRERRFQHPRRVPSKESRWTQTFETRTAPVILRRARWLTHGRDPVGLHQSVCGHQVLRRWAVPVEPRRSTDPVVTWTEGHHDDGGISPRARNGQKVPTSRPMTIRMSTRPSSSATPGWKVSLETPSTNVPSLQWARKPYPHLNEAVVRCLVRPVGTRSPDPAGSALDTRVAFVPAVATGIGAPSARAIMRSVMRFIAIPQAWTRYRSTTSLGRRPSDWDRGDAVGRRVWRDSARSQRIIGSPLTFGATATPIP